MLPLQLRTLSGCGCGHTIGQPGAASDGPEQADMCSSSVAAVPAWSVASRRFRASESRSSCARRTTRGAADCSTCARTASATSAASRTMLTDAASRQMSTCTTDAQTYIVLQTTNRILSSRLGWLPTQHEHHCTISK